MTRGTAVQQIFWIDGIGALAAGVVVLMFREFIAAFYGLPLELVTVIGLVNAGYSAVGLTLANQKRRRVAAIAGLALANSFWAVVCVTLASRYWNDASVFGLAHILIEGVWVAALGAIEWRQRRALAG